MISKDLIRTSALSWDIRQHANSFFENCRITKTYIPKLSNCLQFKVHVLEFVLNFYFLYQPKSGGAQKNNEVQLKNLNGTY